MHLEVLYLCEQFFSDMNVTKNASRNQLDEKLESYRIAGSSILLLVKYAQLLTF
jgi:hypothetical protein